MGMHLRTNADLYHTDYKAIQISQFQQIRNPRTGEISAQSEETNAASAYLEGGELEATIIPINGLEISPHAAYIYSHYSKYPGPDEGGLAFTPPFFFEPKWAYGVHGTYHLPLDSSIGDVAISANYSWVGQQYGSASDNLSIIPSYDNLDLRVDWTNVFQYPVDVSFFMTNVTNNTYIVGIDPLSEILGFDAVSYNEPRMFGFSLKYRFGGPSESEATPAAYVPPPVVAPAPAAKSYLVFFDFNKSDLTPQAKDIVDMAAKNAGPAKVTQLTVTGHTDTVGSDAYNMRLSRRRAESVAAQLEKDGIPSSEISIVAKGKRDLLVPTADGVKAPQNRRVQIVYSGEAGS
jgi:outer membrane protein OmpA-like peptidoglycan-associated protein